MKKFAALALSLTLLFSASSCIASPVSPDTLSESMTEQEGTNLCEPTPTDPITPESSQPIDQTYLDVLENKIKIYDTQNESFCYLIDCKDPYLQTPLYECTNLTYALVDLDGDTVNELVIECPGGTLLLRYYEWYCEGTVFVYEFTFRNMYYLCTDGTYSWNHNGSDFEYGQKQLYFVGTDLRTESLWHIVNDGEPDAEYYIGARQVTEAELTKYINSLTQTKVTFSPLQLSLTHTVTAEQALEIACKFWNIYEGDDCHALGTIYVYHPMILTEQSASHPYYHIGIMVDVYSAETNYQSFTTRLDWRQVTVNAVTGECKWFDPNAKGDDVPQIGK